MIPSDATQKVLPISTPICKVMITMNGAAVDDDDATAAIIVMAKTTRHNYSTANDLCFCCCCKVSPLTAACQIACIINGMHCLARLVLLSVLCSSSGSSIYNS
jgi:hypothetical protein